MNDQQAKSQALKQQEYQERYRFWSDKRISQLSFHNNLLLTVGLGVIGYFLSEGGGLYAELADKTSTKTNWSAVLFCVGVGLSFLSVAAGFMLSLSRLYDLRITSNIVLTRKRMNDKQVSIQGKITREPCFLSSVGTLVAVMCDYQQYHIKQQDIESPELLEKKFNELRQKSVDLGVSTWGLIKWQTLSLLAAFLFFTLTLAFK